MRRLLPLLLCLCLLLTGCANAAHDCGVRFTTGLNARQDLSFTAEIRAEYADRSCSFTLACKENTEGCTVMVLAPDMLKGVRAHLSPEANQLSCDDVTIDTGPLDRYGLSPLSALPTLLRAVREGHLDTAWNEDGFRVCEWILEDGLSARVWIEEASLTPTHAEIISDGRVTVFMDITDWR